VLRGRDLAADDALILTTQDIASGLQLLQESYFPIQRVQVNRFARVKDDSYLQEKRGCLCWNSSSYGLGYKAHIAGDVDSDLPMAFIAASANDNEKKHAAGLLDKTVEVTGGRVETLVADSQYSSRRFREKVADCGVVAVIPYPSNQRKGEDVLRVDRYFRVYGSEEERRLYGLGRSSIERVNSRLEGQVCLDRHRVRGLRNITIHVALCIIAMLLVAVAALRLGVPEKARSIATFGW